MPQKSTDWISCTIISGCSGGGKSTLVDALSERGWITVAEAGRQVVKSELESGGVALPWMNALEFVTKSADLCITQIDDALSTNKASRVISDRSIVDTIHYLEYLGIKTPERLQILLRTYQYADQVFIVPPWEELFVADEERKKSFGEAIAEYECVNSKYKSLGYTLIEMPKTSVKERVAFIENHIENF